MTTSPRVSIVTPSYNQASFIAETIESVLSQAGDFEIEYFVMDGGSTDGSVEIIKHYADQVAAETWPKQCAHVSMRWVSQRDRGQSDAINQGLRQSTGEVVSYINSDDSYPPGAFERVVQEFAAHPEADFIYGDGDVVDEVGQRQWEWLSRPYNHGVMTSYHFLWNDFTNYIMQQATFWRRSVIGRVGYFDETFHYAMDAEYWIRAGQAGLHLRHLPYKLGRFRLIPGTKSLSSPTAFWSDYLEIYRRYRGTRSLSLYFAYFYYNLTRQFDCDFNQAQSHGQKVFERWAALARPEQLALERQARWGFSLACVLGASALHRRHQPDLAAQAWRLGRSRQPRVLLHPFAWMYLLQRLAGSKLAARWEAGVGRLIRWYRWHRYEYRYHPKLS